MLGSNGEESACNAGDPDSIPGLGRSLGEANGYPLQYSCLENPMDRGLKKVLEINDTENTTTENLWDIAKAVIRVKFRAIESYLRKQEKH